MKEMTQLPAGAKSYQKKLTVFAYFSRDGATYHKDWGDQDMKCEHMVIVGPSPGDGFDVYGCDIGRFNDTYEKVAPGTNEYRKKELVKAVQMGEAFSVTTIVDGRVEVHASGGNGDYLVQQPGGELMAVSKVEFENMFVEAGKALPPPLPTSTFTF